MLHKPSDVPTEESELFRTSADRHRLSVVVNRDRSRGELRDEPAQRPIPEFCGKRQQLHRHICVARLKRLPQLLQRGRIAEQFELDSFLVETRELHRASGSSPAPVMLLCLSSRHWRSVFE